MSVVRTASVNQDFRLRYSREYEEMAMLRGLERPARNLISVFGGIPSRQVERVVMAAREVALLSDALQGKFRDDAFVEVSPDGIDDCIHLVRVLNGDPPLEGLIESHVRKGFHSGGHRWSIRVFEREQRDDHVISMSFDHLVLDTESLDLIASYIAGRASGSVERTLRLPQFYDWSDAQRVRLTSSEFSLSVNSVRRGLVDSGCSLFPAEMKERHSARNDGVLHRWERVLSSSQSEFVLSWCRSRRLTPFMLAVAVFSRSLSRCRATSELCIAFNFMNRSHDAEMETLGWLANSVFMAIPRSENLESALAVSRDSFYSASDRGWIPIDSMLNGLGFPYVRGERRMLFARVVVDDARTAPRFDYFHPFLWGTTEVHDSLYDAIELDLNVSDSGVLSFVCVGNGRYMLHEEFEVIVESLSGCIEEVIGPAWS